MCVRLSLTPITSNYLPRHWTYIMLNSITCFQPSIDRVFVTIFHEYKQILIPVILEMVAEANSLVPPDDMQAILKKDAVYNAVGLCAFDMYDEVSKENSQLHLCFHAKFKKIVIVNILYLTM